MRPFKLTYDELPYATGSSSIVRFPHPGNVANAPLSKVDSIQKEFAEPVFSRRKDVNAVERIIIRRRPRGGPQQSLFLDLPLDIMYEIFSHMTPQDLIRLSAVAKSLLAFFWSKSSKFAWENSARNMPLLPERPLELSWPRYAEMIFSKTCSHARKGKSSGCRGKRAIVWLSWTKACVSCLASLYVKKGGRRYPVELGGKYSPIQRIIFPRTETWHAQTAAYCLESEAEALLATYNEKKFDAKELEAWITSEVELKTQRLQHGHKCEPLLASLREEEHAIRSRACEDRKEAILRRLSDLGWSDELEYQKQNYTGRKFLASMSDSAKPLTDTSWRTIKDRYIRVLTEIRNTRQEEELLRKWKRRYTQFWEDLQAVLLESPVITTGPPDADFALHPKLQNILRTVPIDEEITRHQLRSAVTSLKDDFQQIWLAKAEAAIYYLMREADFKAPETEIHLATVVFHCSRCGQDLHAYRIYIHTCTTIPKGDELRRFGHTRGSAEEFMYMINHVAWHPRFFSVRKSQNIVSIVKACGLDPETALYFDLVISNCVLERPLLDALSSQRSGIRHRQLFAWNVALFEESPQANAYDWVVVDKDDVGAILVQHSAMAPKPDSAWKCQWDPPKPVCCALCTERFRMAPEECSRHMKRFHSLDEYNWMDWSWHPDSMANTCYPHPVVLGSSPTIRQKRLQ